MKTIALTPTNDEAAALLPYVADMRERIALAIELASDLESGGGRAAARATAAWRIVRELERQLKNGV